MHARSRIFRGLLWALLSALPAMAMAVDTPNASRATQAAHADSNDIANAPTDGGDGDGDNDLSAVSRIDAKPAWPSPADEQLALLTALRENNFTDLVLATGGPDAYRRLSEGWQRDRAEITSRRESAKTAIDPGDVTEPTAPDEFSTVWTLLQTDEGVETLIRDWQPKIAESAQTNVIQFNIGLAAMMNALSDNGDLTPEEQAQQRALLLAIQAWANRTDFSNPTPLRRVVQAMATEARATGAATLEDLKLLSFERAMTHGDGLLRVARVALEAYGLDPDDALRSVRISEVAREGDRVTVRVEARLLGVLVTQQKTYRPYYGHWREAPEVARGLGESDDAEIESTPSAAQPATPAAPVEQAPSTSTSKAAIPPVGKCSIDATAPASEGKS